MAWFKCMWVNDLHFMVQWFCLISWRLLDGLILYWRYWFSVTQTFNWNYIGMYNRPIFNGPVIFPDILKTIWWKNVIIGILDPCDAKIYQIKCMWVSDLQFMVQWFCLISWRLFDGLMLCWRYWFNVTQTLNWNYIRRPVTLYFVVQWFCLICWRLLIVMTGILDPYDVKINHITYMRVSDLHFMIQRFWHILKTF